MATTSTDLGQELTNVPFGQMVRSMALAVADAQWELDKASMTVAEMMSGTRLMRNLDTGALIPGPDGKAPHVIDSRVQFGYTYEPSADGKSFERKPQKVSMMELGFVPNFYQFVDSIIEVKISIKVSTSTEDVSSRGSNSSSNNAAASSSAGSSGYGCWGWWYGYGCGGASWGSSSSSHNVSAAHVDASYANRYGYSAEGASLFRTKLVPIPPPAVLEERIRTVVATEKAYNDWVLAETRATNDTEREFAKTNFYRRLEGVAR